jgi:hypothetical protein
MRRIGRRHYWNTRGSSTWQAMTDELPFRVVHSNSYDETLARCTNLPIAHPASTG